MGFFDVLKGKKAPAKEQQGEKPVAGKSQALASRAEKKKEEPAEEPEGKYNETCSLCGHAGTEKKWMGQYWHKKCLRGVRKTSRKMI